MGNEKIEQLVISMGERLAKYLDSAESIVIDNAPALVQEIYSYYLTLSWIMVIIFGVIALGLLIWYILYNVDNMSDGEDLFMSALCFSIPFIVSFAVFLLNLITIIKINIAPKLFLIQKIMELIR